jgi:hypothetical protein
MEANAMNADIRFAWGNHYPNPSLDAFAGRFGLQIDTEIPDETVSLSFLSDRKHEIPDRKQRNGVH